MKVIEVRIAVPDDDFNHQLDTGGGRLLPNDELGDWIAEVVGDGLLIDGYYLVSCSVLPLTLPKRVGIYPSTYRSQPGFSVRDDRGQSVFTTTRASAEKIKARMKRGEDIRQEDWTA